MDLYDIQFTDNTAAEGAEARRQVEAIIAAKDAQIAALSDLLAAVRECKHLGDFAIRKHINAALELYDETMKGA